MKFPNEYLSFGDKRFFFFLQEHTLDVPLTAFSKKKVSPTVAEGLTSVKHLDNPTTLLEPFFS